MPILSTDYDAALSFQPKRCVDLLLSSGLQVPLMLNAISPAYEVTGASIDEVNGTYLRDEWYKHGFSYVKEGDRTHILYLESLSNGVKRWYISDSAGTDCYSCPHDAKDTFKWSFCPTSRWTLERHCWSLRHVRAHSERSCMMVLACEVPTS